MKNPVNIHKRAFTLIEILVVIAIIALLAAILFPVFARAREKARQANCMSNLKQFGLAIMMYTQDYDERYPPALEMNGTQWEYSIVNMLDPYTNNRGLWKCPSQNTTAIQADPSLNNTPFSFNYTVNYQVMGFLSTPPNTYLPLSLATVQDPSGTLMMFCWPGSAFGDTMYLGSPSDIILKRTSDLAAGKPDPLQLHNGGNLLLFTDAHAKWEPPSVLLKTSTWTPAAD